MEETTRISHGTKVTLTSDVSDNVGQGGLGNADNAKEVVYQIQFGGIGVGVSW